MRRLGGEVLGRLRKRYVAAVALPVALVALGASLLADAHARAFDKEARAKDAVDIAHAAFESLGTGDPDDIAGRTEAIEAAAALGFHVQIVPTHEGVEILRQGDEGETQVTVPLQPGAALVRFGTTRLSAAFAAYILLAMAAVGLAAILGTRAAAFFDSDIALATREIRRAGVAEVMRGTIILHEARFSTVTELLEAIDTLGGIFREFASAQRRAIEAREATERMRGLLLASMSHDLKAPLNAVLGFTELVRRNPLTKEQNESLAIIEQRGRELLVLIDTILDSARVEAGELEVSPAPTLVDDVVMSSVLEARDLSVGSEVQIMGEIQPGIPTLPDRRHAHRPGAHRRRDDGGALQRQGDRPGPRDASCRSGSAPANRGRDERRGTPRRRTREDLRRVQERRERAPSGRPRPRSPAGAVDRRDPRRLDRGRQHGPRWHGLSRVAPGEERPRVDPRPREPAEPLVVRPAALAASRLS